MKSEKRLRGALAKGGSLALRLVARGDIALRRRRRPEWSRGEAVLEVGLSEREKECARAAERENEV